MKNIILVVLAVLFISAKDLSAQTDSKGFNFQGYAIDPDGKALGTTGITVKFTIYPQGGNEEYSEEIAVTTDIYGVFTAVIGSKAPASFAKINFNAKVYNLKVEVKRTSAGEYVTISDGQFMSVPYARSASNGVPVGSIIPFGGPETAIPDGWLACDGRSITKTNYPQLFNVIAYSWGGSGDNFNIPELRGYFLRGVASNQDTDPDRAARTALKTGGNAGDNVGSYQPDEFKGHNHPGSTNTTGSHQHSKYTNYEASDDGDGAAGFENSDGEYENSHTGWVNPNGDHSHTVSTENRGGNESRPKNAYVWFIIKF